MGVYKDNRPTKDGKIWFYKTQYEDIDGTHKTKKSGRYATKKEAEDAQGYKMDVCFGAALYLFLKKK